MCLESNVMITGEGGFVHRMMPPADWDCGTIPTECYNESLTRRDIEDLLRPVYLAEDRVKALANSDDKMELFRAKLSLEILIEIDAETIWWHNQMKK